MWKKLEDEFLLLLLSVCVAETGGCVFVIIMECV